MPESFTISIFVLLTLILVVWNVIRSKDIAQLQTELEELSMSLGLKISFSTRDDFLLYGKMNNYDVKIYPWKPSSIKRDNSYTFFSLRMYNPSLKSVQIKKPHPDYPELESSYFEKLSIKMKHDFGDQVKMSTNDIVFTSLFLSDDIKIDMGLLLQKIKAGCWYISGDTMAFILPQESKGEKFTQNWEEIMKLIVDIKDEINFR